MAKYAIFDSAASSTSKKHKEFMQFLETAETYGVPAVSGRYIQDCVEKGKLLNHKDYLFKVPPKAKRRRSTTEVSSSEDEVAKPPSRKQTPVVASKKPKKQIKMMDTLFPEKVDLRFGPRGPTNKFTPEEVQRAMEIAKQMFIEDPEVPESVVAKAISLEVRPVCF